MDGLTTTSPLLDKYGLIQSIAKQPGQKNDENVFLTLLVTQLQNQDPLSPMENAEFIQQVATFSSLEESQNLNAKLADLITIQEVVAGQNAFTQSASLVGKTVEYAHPDTGEPATGFVGAVHVTDAGLVLDIDGLEVPLGLVTGIVTEAPADEPAPQEETPADEETQETD
jgi:flagellar basal-body rod modification protein FlgD